MLRGLIAIGSGKFDGARQWGCDRIGVVVVHFRHLHAYYLAGYDAVVDRFRWLGEYASHLLDQIPQTWKLGVAAGVASLSVAGGVTALFWMSVLAIIAPHPHGGPAQPQTRTASFFFATPSEAATRQTASDRTEILTTRTLPLRTQLRVASYSGFGPNELTRRTGSFFAASLGGHTHAPEFAKDDKGLATMTVALKKGDTLMKLLVDAGAPKDDARNIVAAMKPIYNPFKLKAGQAFDISYVSPHGPGGAPNTIAKAAAAEARLIKLRMQHGADREVVVERMGNGTFEAKEVVYDLYQAYVRTAGRIENSLYGTARKIGIPERVIAEFTRIFAYSVDFQSGIRAGDTFQILYTQYEDEEGRMIKTGDIYYAAITTGGRRHDLYRYTPPGDKKAEYFDPNGGNAKKFLMRTPVDAARISSRFGRRYHPIRKRWKLHKGVDFAARTGSKIYAAGNGIVTYAGWARGYGNLIKIRHANGYETRYGHMSRLASGMKSGRRVTQGQVIGYVGATGWATGPHLHYEVRRNGKATNPLAIKVPTGRKLAGKELFAFRDAIEKIEQKRMAARALLAPRTARAGTNQAAVHLSDKRNGIGGP